MMRRLLYFLIFLILIGIIFLAGYTFFGDLSPPAGPVEIPVEIGTD